MDKNTLSNYGWIVIAVLVLSVMIALATPFGEYIKAGVESTTAGLFDTENKALDVVLPAKNLVKPEKCEYGYWDSNGAIIASTVMGHSDYIPVEYGKTYKYSSTITSPSIVFFDENQEIVTIKNVNPTYLTEYFTVNDESVKYISFNIIMGDIDYIYCYEADASEIKTRTLSCGFIGDSITAGCMDNEFGKTRFRFSHLLAEKLNIYAYEYGHGGAKLAGNDDMSITNRISTMHGSLDKIFVMGGINDFMGGTQPFGSISDTTTDTFYGSLNVLFTNINTKYGSDIDVVFLTPLKVLGRHTSVNTTTGKTLDEYVNAIKDVAALYDNVEIIDTYTWSLTNMNDSDYWDGIHPTNGGHSKIADYVYSEIVKLNIL